MDNAVSCSFAFIDANAVIIAEIDDFTGRSRCASGAEGERKSCALGIEWIEGTAGSIPVLSGR